MADGQEPHSEDDAFGLPPEGERYYFDSRDGDRFVRDDEGLTFPSIEAARDEAMRALAEIAKDVLPGAARRELVIEVRNEAGRPVLRASIWFEVAILSE